MRRKPDPRRIFKKNRRLGSALLCTFCLQTEKPGKSGLTFAVDYANMQMIRDSVHTVMQQNPYSVSHPVGLLRQAIKNGRNHNEIHTFASFGRSAVLCIAAGHRNRQRVCDGRRRRNRREQLPDAFFRKDIAAAFDKNGDGILSAEEAATVTYLDYGIGNLNTEFTPGGTRKDKGAYTITDLTGVEHFPNLEKLYVNGYDELCALTKLDVSQNTKLKDLFCASNQLTELNLNGLSALQELDCEDNLLAFLDLSDCAALERLVCDTNSLTELDLSSNPLLSFVYCYSTDISVLNLSKHTKLTNVSCANTAITTLDVSNSPELLSLDICGTRIQSLNLSNNTKLQT